MDFNEISSKSVWSNKKISFAQFLTCGSYNKEFEDWNQLSGSILEQDSVLKVNSEFLKEKFERVPVNFLELSNAKF